MGLVNASTMVLTLLVSWEGILLMFVGDLLITYKDELLSGNSEVINL